MTNVILVDERDNEVGVINQLEAHNKGLLHRAFSVFIINSKGEWLLQQRSAKAEHSAGLWTNTCSGHPTPEEKDTRLAVLQCLQNEMGFSCDLEEVHTFIYDTKFDNGLMECEFNHVFLGKYDGEVAIDNEVVADYKWLSDGEIGMGLRDNPDTFSYWFRLVYPKVSALRMQ